MIYFIFHTLANVTQTPVKLLPNCHTHRNESFQKIPLNRHDRSKSENHPRTHTRPIITLPRCASRFSRAVKSGSEWCKPDCLAVHATASLSLRGWTEHLQGVSEARRRRRRISWSAFRRRENDSTARVYSRSTACVYTALPIAAFLSHVLVYCIRREVQIRSYRDAIRFILFRRCRGLFIRCAPDLQLFDYVNIFPAQNCWFAGGWRYMFAGRLIGGAPRGYLLGVSERWDCKRGVHDDWLIYKVIVGAEYSLQSVMFICKCGRLNDCI